MIRNISYIFLCVFVMAALSACSSSAPTKIQSEYLSMLEKPASEESIFDIGAYLDKNLKKFDKENADQMIVAYEDYIYTLDGENPDYAEFAERYKKYISEYLAELYYIKAEEQKSPLIADSKLRYTWDKICEKTIALEIFIKDGENSKLVREEAADIYVYYIKSMLMGTSETPIFGYDDGNFSEDAKAAYSECRAAYPDTVIGDLLNEYFDYLESIHFNLNYKKAEEKTSFSDMCAYIVSDARKRVLQ